MINLDLLPEKITIKGILNFRGENTVWIDGVKLSPKHSQKIRNHSPTGFNWGYGGSGPAQLALAILLLYWLPDNAETFYQDFKFVCIAGLPQSDFVQEFDLRAIMKEIIEKRSHELKSR